jgi:molybdenum cofactor cytidylyltransferase
LSGGGGSGILNRNYATHGLLWRYRRVITGIVLAAGRSRRMGRPKALLSLGGATFLARAVNALLRGGCDDVLVVTGDIDISGSSDIAAEARSLGAGIAINPRERSEQIDSLRVGLGSVASAAEAVVVLPVDIPLVTAAAVSAVIDGFTRGGAPIVRATHRGEHAHPVLFARSVFSELMHGDLPDGARTVIHDHAGITLDVEVGTAGMLEDVDTPEDYRRVTAMFE